MHIACVHCDVEPTAIMKFDYDWKILLIGDSAVGKTCLTLRIGSSRFEENYVLTIGKLILLLSVSLLNWCHFCLVGQVSNTSVDGLLSLVSQLR